VGQFREIGWVSLGEIHHQPKPIPDFPKFPKRPPNDLVPSGFIRIAKRTEKRAEALEIKAKMLKQEFEQTFSSDMSKLGVLKKTCLNVTPEKFTCLLLKIADCFFPLPPKLRLTSFDVDYDPTSRIVINTIELPDLSKLKIVKEKDSRPLSQTARKQITETIFYSLILRAAYLTSKSDAGNWFDLIAINVKQKWNDPATGTPREGIIASLQTSKEEIIALHLNNVDPKSCFRHLKGISTPSLERITPVRPIFVMNKDDRRIIENRDIAEGLESESNLALMPWEDFEHLIRQLFEWEFADKGIEVKVTRASHDRGVDAIMFDPDPLRGGKYVLQAKRYTRPVDVAAVRDLYGTILNEGANRGILVTTSSYGPDTYEFSKDKPISLVDGPNLILMLQRHGRKYRIDIEEARKMNLTDG
jgi:restriction system protein